jgi:septation ring formation regulator EzrA
VRSISERVEAIEDRIDDMTRELTQLRKQAAEAADVSADQARLDVEEGSAAS